MIPDDRVSLLEVANGGASRARNLAFERSSGGFVIFFDADDYVRPDFVASQMKKMSGRTMVTVLSAWGRFYGEDMDTFQPVDHAFEEMNFEEWINRFWRRADPMTTPGRVMMPRAVVEAAGPWNETLNLNDDLEFYTRVFLQSKEIIYNPRALFYYRSGIQGLSGMKGPNAFTSLYRSLDLAIEEVLHKWPDRTDIKESCANMWQSFVYEVYPTAPSLVASAELKIKELGGATLPFPSGGYSRWFSNTFGWKATKHIKELIKNR
jgi:glycosyltransferase involved in cell wall biosynthesis